MSLVSEDKDPLLTELERGLLDCVERLTLASEGLEEQFSALERRSTGQIKKRLEVLETSVILLLRSQAALTDTFSAYARASSNSEIVLSNLSGEVAALIDVAESVKTSSLYQ